MLYGLKVRSRVISAFVLSGALAGLAGVLFAARYGTVSSGAGTGIELQAVAAVVIGGVAIFGGSGTVWGAAIGAVLLVTINRALPILGIPDFWQRAVVGALILSSIVLDRVLAAPAGPQAHRGEGRAMSDTITRSLPRLLRSPVVASAARSPARAQSSLLLVAVIVYSLVNVANFDGPLTMTFLLLDTTPILLIALPMTLVIVTGEIDLSVASVVGLSSVLLGVLTDAGWSVPAAGLAALVVGVLLRRPQRLPRRVRRTALTGGHDRHPGPLPWHRRRPARHQGGHRLRRQVDRASPRTELGETGIPQVMVLFVVLAVVFTVLLHFTSFGRGVYDIGLTAEAAHFTGVNVARTKFLLFLLSGVVSAFAGIYCTLRFGSARGRQRDRTGAAGDRGRPPRRRLDLRRPREARTASSPACSSSASSRAHCDSRA